MATMNISLPGPMKEWVEAQSKTGRYSNASDYVRDLIRRDQERGANGTNCRRCAFIASGRIWLSIGSTRTTKCSSSACAMDMRTG